RLRVHRAADTRVERSARVDPALRGRAAFRALPRLGVALPALDARPWPLQGPELRGYEPRDADRLLGLDRSLLLRHALPAADRRLLASGGRLRHHPDLTDPLRPLAGVRQDRDEHGPSGADVCRTDCWGDRAPADHSYRCE